MSDCLSIKTFKDLYLFLQNYQEDDITEWLKINWKGKDKQESLLRLFAALNLINKLNQYDICGGNFNLKTIYKISNIKDIFYDKNNKLVMLKDKGDKSDLTMIHKENSRRILVISSKSRKNSKSEGIGKYDIRDLLCLFMSEYKDNFDKIDFGIATRDKKRLKKKINNCEECNYDIKNLLTSETTVIVDWKDLNIAFHKFKEEFKSIQFDDIINLTNNRLSFKLHQRLSIMKTLRLKKNNIKEILWGHIQRSGKSYIVAGSIIEDSKKKNKCNYFIITTAPKETLQQLKFVCECDQLKDFNVQIINRENSNPIITNKNIIICSKQFLQSKINGKKAPVIQWLKKMKFEMRFIDESHNGGTTELAKNTLKCYGNKAFTVYMTATYYKPINDYNIPNSCWILWDLQDIRFCKTINKRKSFQSLVDKHGNDFADIMQYYSIDEIIKEYSRYPELWVLTHDINCVDKKELIEKTRNNSYGWSPDACFLLKQCFVDGNKKFTLEFQNEKENLKLWHLIFGKKDRFGIIDKEFSNCFIERIKKICHNPEINSRFMGEKEFCNEPMIIMAFLPQDNISNVSEATKNLLEKYNVIPNFEIICINSNVTNDPKQKIENARIKARNSGKQGVLVLSGKQCSLGVTINNCDIVLLLNSNSSYDMINQMMFRSMTEGTNKTCGFVVDLNIDRAIETTVMNYASLIKPKFHPRNAIKYILKERLIVLNGDQWVQGFAKNHKENLNKICKDVYKLYTTKLIRPLENVMKRFNLKKDKFLDGSYELFRSIFKNVKFSKQKCKEINDTLKQLDDEKIKSGIEKKQIKVSLDSNPEAETKDKKQNKINPFDILQPISVLISLLTIEKKKATKLIEMNEIIQKDYNKKMILVNQIKTWWGENIEDTDIELLINIFINYMEKDPETEMLLLRIKELICKNKNNREELSKLIDKYLIPQEREKKNNAEVSTPFWLRKDKLDRMPHHIWCDPNAKVFEPSSGKGGYLIDIIDRFMIGLKDVITDEKLRYKHIVEKILYFSDINPTNIFINKLLIDPNNIYNLNYNEGNTLELNIKEKWDIDGFDAVIGNPPYNDNSGNKGRGHTLWTKFIEVALDKWLKAEGYLLYVTPSLWRQADHSLQKTMKKYQIEYLEIHDESDGVKTFKCNTRYDWYLIKKVKYYKNTLIKTQKDVIVSKDLRKMNFIPNYNYDLIDDLTKGDDKIDMLYSRSDYASDKKHTRKTRDEEYKYPVVYSVNRKNTPKFLWSKINTKEGHYGKKKVIFGSGATGFIIDDKGEYACCEFCTGVIDKKKNLENIKTALNSTKFKNEFVKATAVSKAEINRKILKYLKKDFWKEFI